MHASCHLLNSRGVCRGEPVSIYVGVVAKFGHRGAVYLFGDTGWFREVYNKEG